MSDYGYQCERCGLSDFGFDRLSLLKYDPHPCRDCRAHFEQRERETDQ